MSFNKTDYQLHWDAATNALWKALEVLGEDPQNQPLVQSLQLQALVGVPLVKVRQTTLVALEKDPESKYRCCLMLAKNHDCWGSDTAKPVYRGVPVATLEELHGVLAGWWVVAGEDLPASAKSESVHPWLAERLLATGFLADDRENADESEDGLPLVLVTFGNPEPVVANMDLPLRVAVEEVLKRVKSRKKNWLVLNKEGVQLDPDVVVEDYGFEEGTELIVTLPVGSGS